MPEMRKTTTEITLDGYVNLAGRRSRGIIPASDSESAPGPFVECVQPGAFRQALFLQPNVLLKVNHGRVIGSTRGGELRLEEDAIGLKATALIRDEDIIYAAMWGRIQGWSFGFHALEESWEQIGDHLYRRMVKRLRLNEVSLLLNKRPAYPGTTVNLVEVNRHDC